MLKNPSANTPDSPVIKWWCSFGGYPSGGAAARRFMYFGARMQVLRGEIKSRQRFVPRAVSAGDTFVYLADTFKYEY